MQFFLFTAGRARCLADAADVVGGHTMEMLRLLGALDERWVTWQGYRPAPSHANSDMITSILHAHQPPFTVLCHSVGLPPSPSLFSAFPSSPTSSLEPAPRRCPLPIHSTSLSSRRQHRCPLSRSCSAPLAIFPVLSSWRLNFCDFSLRPSHVLIPCSSILFATQIQPTDVRCLGDRQTKRC